MAITLDENAIKKINLIDSFRERFSAETNAKLKLPQIIVVGDQTTGKSSILEAVSGIKLPKGLNTVTVCPLVIQMRESKNESTKIKYKNVDYKIIDDTEKQIRKVQTDIFDNQLTEEPIYLLKESPNVRCLTIIDLPGIVKTRSTGHQANVINKTHEIATTYMNQEESLILCVLPADRDIASTDTIELAKKCDPTCSRIIGVVTRIDKLSDEEMDNLCGTLDNTRVPLKKGYFGLMVSDKYLKLDNDQRENEENNIFGRSQLLHKCRERLGIKNFINKLVEELNTLIDKNIPILEQSMTRLLEETNDHLRGFSKYHGNRELQQEYMIKVVDTFVSDMNGVIVDATTTIKTFPKCEEFVRDKILTNVGNYDTFLFCWHKIYGDLFSKFDKIFKDLFVVRNAKYKNPKDLEDMIKRSRTENISAFMNSKAFKVIIDECLEKFLKESLDCLKECSDFTKFIIESLIDKDIDDELSDLKLEMKDICIAQFVKQEKKTSEMIKYLFASETSYFSQDAIVEKYDTVENNPSNGPTVAGDQKSKPLNNINPQNLPKSPSVPLSQISNAVVPQSISNPFSGDSNDDAKYQNGKKLKEILDKYVRNLINRLGDTVPNFIRQSLFVDLQLELRKTLIKHISTEAALKHFKLSDEQEKSFQRLKDTKKALEKSRCELKQFMSVHQNR